MACQQESGSQVHVFTQDQVGRKAARLPQGREPEGGKRFVQKAGFDAFVGFVLRGDGVVQQRVVEEAGVRGDGGGVGVGQLSAVGGGDLGDVKGGQQVCQGLGVGQEASCVRKIAKSAPWVLPSVDLESRTMMSWGRMLWLSKACKNSTH